MAFIATAHLFRTTVRGVQPRGRASRSRDTQQNIGSEPVQSACASTSCSALRVPGGMMSTGSRSPGRAVLALVGRDRELAELSAGLEDALAGQGRLFLIAGEPGIGKTGLAEALGRLAAERGACVVWGRCWEGGGAPPFWPWVQVVREVSEAFDDDTLKRLLGSGATYITQLAPDLADRLGRSSSPNGPAFESDTARFYLFEAVARFLKRAAAEQPLLLLLEDLHA